VPATRDYPAVGLFSGAKVRSGVEAASDAFDRGDHARAISLGQQAAALARRHRRFADEGTAMVVVYRGHLMLGQLTGAGRVLDAIRVAADGAKQPMRALLQWQVEHNRGLLHDLAMRVPDAMSAFKRAVGVAEHALRSPAFKVSGHAPAMGHYRRQSLLAIADLLGRTGKVAEAMRLNDDVVNLAWQDRDGPIVLAAMADRSWLNRLVGDADAAAGCVSAALDSLHELDFSMATHVGALTIMVRVATEAARLQALAGNAEGLDEGFALGRQMAEQAGSAELLSELLAVEVETALLFGRTERALEITQALRSIESTNPVMTARVLRSQAHTLAANGQPAEAYACFTELVPLYHELAQPVSAFHASIRATGVAAGLDRPADAISLVREAIRGRTQLLACDADDRANWLTVATHADRAGVTDAGLVALEVAETWREAALAATLHAHHETLPGDLRELVGRVDALRAALTQPPPATTAFPDSHSQPRLQAQLDDLRAQLAKTAGDDFANHYVPTPVSGEQILAACGERPLISLTATDSSGNVTGHTTWTVPGEPVSVRRFELSPPASEVVRQLHTGRAGTDQNERAAFTTAWLDVRDELADLLLPARLRDWLAGHDSELVTCADGAVRNVPIAALPVGDREVVADLATVNRLPLLRLATNRVDGLGRPGPVRVLGAFDRQLKGSTRERDTLQELDQVELTEVTKPDELLTALTEHEFDLLVLSTPGSGTGLDYRFHLPHGDLAVASLSGVRVPEAVVAAACHSGADADATGALALLLSAGARDVVAGSWDLPDHQTGALLSRMYRALGTGAPLPRLLNQAQRTAHLRLNAANPLSWAGLVATSR
jgi:hypothetical protein